jgi:hypothetical protein
LTQVNSDLALKADAATLLGYISKTDLRFTGDIQFVRMSLANTGDVNTSVVQIDFFYNDSDFFRIEFTKQGTVFTRYANGQWG